jgi:hypothetical protein
LRRRRESIAVLFAVWFAASVEFVPSAAAQLVAGDVYVTDFSAGTDCTGGCGPLFFEDPTTGQRIPIGHFRDFMGGLGCGALFRVDPTTGQRTLVSDFGNSAQGTRGRAPFAVAFDDAGLLVLDQRAGTDCNKNGFVGCGALFRIDVATGQRTLVSDFGNSAQGPTGLTPFDLTVDSSGRILVTDRDAGTLGGVLGLGKLFLVDPTDGTRTVLSDFENDTLGKLGENPSGVAVEATGRILVAVPATAPFPTGVLFTVDPTTGLRAVLSDFTNTAQGTLGQAPIDVRPASNGQLWVLDQVASTTDGTGLGKLFLVNRTTGARKVVSDLSTATQGRVAFNASALDVTSAGDVLLIDSGKGTDSRGALLRVNPSTGRRIVVSDFGASTHGTLGVEPTGLAIVPPRKRPRPGH